MKEEEKEAKELKYKYRNCIVFGVYLSDEQIKQCALICVDQIIEEVRDYCDVNHHSDRMVHYMTVRKIIEQY